MLASGMGSSVMKSTRSRLTLAKRRISLNSNVQYGFTDRFSTLDKSPPERMMEKKMVKSKNFIEFHWIRVNSVEFYWILLSSNEFHWNLLSSIEFSWNRLKFVEFRKTSFGNISLRLTFHAIKINLFGEFQVCKKWISTEKNVGKNSKMNISRNFRTRHKRK